MVAHQKPYKMVFYKNISVLRFLEFSYSSNLSQKDQEILLHLHPFQCLEIKSSQDMNMQNRHAYFNDFKFRTLLESQRECRKIKVNKRISIR